MASIDPYTVGADSISAREHCHSRNTARRGAGAPPCIPMTMCAVGRHAPMPPRAAAYCCFPGVYRSTFSEKCFVKNCTNGPSPNAQISVPNPISPPSR